MKDLTPTTRCYGPSLAYCQGEKTGVELVPRDPWGWALMGARPFEHLPVVSVDPATPEAGGKERYADCLFLDDMRRRIELDKALRWRYPNLAEPIQFLGKAISLKRKKCPKP